MRRLARLTSNRELWFDPADRTAIVREPGKWPGWRPRDLKHSVERRSMQSAIRELVFRQERERAGRPLMAFPEHVATLNAAIDMNDDIEPRLVRYSEELYL